MCLCSQDKSSSGDGVVSRAVQEFSQLEDQLSGVERYAMKFLEAENAEKADERLRQAEVCSVRCMYRV